MIVDKLIYHEKTWVDKISIGITQCRIINIGKHL